MASSTWTHSNHDYRGSGGFKLRFATIHEPGDQDDWMSIVVNPGAGPCVELGSSVRDTEQQAEASAASSEEVDLQMTTHDRHIDERLAYIEQGLDRRMADLQRFQERAEDRFERATERHDAELALQRQKTDESYRSLFTLVDGSRKHASNMAAVTIFGTVGGVLAALALVVTLGAGWISDQGTYAQSYGENQVEMQQAADERAEFRETMKSIQATQQAILDRLPEPPPAE